MTNPEILQEMFGRNLISQSHHELAEAIVCGHKIKDLGIQAIQSSTDGLIDKFMTYYGFSNEDDACAAMKKLCPVDLFKHRQHLTIQEVCVGAFMAAHGTFGEVKMRYNSRFSLDYLNQLINAYYGSQERKRIVQASTAIKNTLIPTVDRRTPEEKKRSNIKLCIEQFSRYKANPQNAFITHMDFNILLGIGVAVPDYRGLMQEAQAHIEAQEKSRLRRGQQRQMSSIEPTQAHLNHIEAVSKMLAVTSLYKDLIAQGVTMQQYIDSCLKPAINA